MSSRHETEERAEPSYRPSPRRTGKRKDYCLYNSKTGQMSHLRLSPGAPGGFRARTPIAPPSNLPIMANRAPFPAEALGGNNAELSGRGAEHGRQQYPAVGLSGPPTNRYHCQDHGRPRPPVPYPEASTNPLHNQEHARRPPIASLAGRPQIHQFQWDAAEDTSVVECACRILNELSLHRKDSSWNIPDFPKIWEHVRDRFVAERQETPLRTITPAGVKQRIDSLTSTRFELRHRGQLPPARSNLERVIDAWNEIQIVLALRTQRDPNSKSLMHRLSQTRGLVMGELRKPLKYRDLHAWIQSLQNVAPRREVTPATHINQSAAGVIAPGLTPETAIVIGDDGSAEDFPPVHSRQAPQERETVKQEDMPPPGPQQAASRPQQQNNTSSKRQRDNDVSRLAKRPCHSAPGHGDGLARPDQQVGESRRASLRQKLETEISGQSFYGHSLEPLDRLVRDATFSEPLDLVLSDAETTRASREEGSGSETTESSDNGNSSSETTESSDDDDSSSETTESSDDEESVGDEAAAIVNLTPGMVIPSVEESSSERSNNDAFGPQILQDKERTRAASPESPAACPVDEVSDVESSDGSEGVRENLESPGNDSSANGSDVEEANEGDIVEWEGLKQATLSSIVDERQRLLMDLGSAQGLWWRRFRCSPPS